MELRLDEIKGLILNKKECPFHFSPNCTGVYDRFCSICKECIESNQALSKASKLTEEKTG